MTPSMVGLTFALLTLVATMATATTASVKLRSVKLLFVRNFDYRSTKALGGEVAHAR
jgi:hypothetical protein